ncbi:MAG: hypothetical protein NT075_24390 [Chloroflexi bacterium]|nr:hypothetical protein [Chloroflexota bacterium]
MKINRSFEIKVTAEEARRKVNLWLMNEVSSLIGAEAPTLVIGEQVVWRVPAWIGFPHTGRADTVGTIDVDVQTGVMDNTPERQVEIERCAQAVAARMPRYQPRQAMPNQYLAKNVPSAPKLTLDEDGAVKLANLSESH